MSPATTTDRPIKVMQSKKRVSRRRRGTRSASRARMRRVLGWSALLVVLLLLVSIGGLNALLATAWPKQWMNGDPDHLRVDYGRAWTLWPPLAIHLEDLDLSFQDPDSQVQLQGSRVTGYISPWALLSLRLQARGVTASGVVFKLRPRVLPDDKTVHREWLPDIDGFPSPEKVPGEAWPELITFDLRAMQLTDVREVWVGEVRYRGATAISGGMVFEPLRALMLDDLAITDANGVLTRGDQTLLTLTSLSARADLDRLPFKDASVTDLKKLTANVTLIGELDAAYAANFAVRSVPWLTVAGADGLVTADVRLVRGVLQDGSSLVSKAPGVRLVTPFVSLRGQGEVKLTAAEGIRRLELVLLGPTLTGADKTPWMTAERFRLLSKGPADLTAPDVFDGVLTLTQARADDLRFLNRFLPKSTGLSIVKGDGLVNATLAIDSSTSKGSGEVEATFSKLELASRVSRLVGKADVKARLRSVDLATGVMRLDGSSFEFTDATVFADQRRYDGFWFKARVPELTLSVDGPVRTTATIAFEVQHLQPVMGLVEAQVPVPFPVRLMSEHHDVSFTASLRVAPDLIELTDVRVHAEALDVWADLAVRETPGVWGAVLVKSMPVIAALELRGVSQKTVLADAVPWFHKWRAAQAKR